MKKIFSAFLALVASILIHGEASALSCSPFPFTLTNGTTADANQVMADFNILPVCIANIPGTPITWTALQTFTSGDFALAGSTSGTTVLNASAVASGILTLPAATDTLVGRATTDTLTNKTLTSPTIAGGTFSGGALFAGSTSGTTTLQASAVASGTLTLPAATDTLVGQSTADTLSNKTIASATLTGNTVLPNGGLIRSNFAGFGASSSPLPGTDVLLVEGTSTTRLQAYSIGGQFSVLNIGSGALGTHTTGLFFTDDTNNKTMIGTGTSTPLIFDTNNAEVARFDTSGRLGIGMTPANVLDITQNQNAGSFVSILNNNAGTGAFTEFQVTNGTHTGQIYQLGTGWTTSGINRQDGTVVQGGGAGGLTLNTNANQPIYFSVNGTQAFELDTNRHQITSGPAPTCGVNCLSISGNDNAFSFTSVGTNQTGFSVNFGATWAAVPICNVTSGNVASAAQVYIGSVTTSVLTINLNATSASVTFYINCRQ